jgi:hypothetical protein
VRGVFLPHARPDVGINGLRALDRLNRVMPGLHACSGFGRQRFQDAANMQCFAGPAPVTVRSGKSKWVHRRFACPTFVCQTFHEFAAQSRLKSPWAKAYYQQMRDKGVDHHSAVRALAFKRIRIRFRCWQERTPYNEARY